MIFDIFPLEIQKIVIIMLFIRFLWYYTAKSLSRFRKVLNLNKTPQRGLCASIAKQSPQYQETALSLRGSKYQTGTPSPPVGHATAVCRE